MLFMLRLKHQDSLQDGTARYTERPTVDEACDAAMRWLRLYRNARPGMSNRYDRWEVLVPNEEKGYQVVASGDSVN